MIKVYYHCRDLNTTEICNLGCKHHVTYHEQKFLTRREEEDYQKWIIGLNYTSDGYGTVRVAYDAQGRRYESEDTWNGYGPWKRINDKKVYWKRPMFGGDVARTLDGNII